MMSDKLNSLFERQAIFQSLINEDDYSGDYPRDDVENYSANALLMVEDIGELLKTDKRWRTFRGGNHDEVNKSSEIADIAIVLTNICLYSGMTADDLVKAMSDKIDVNMMRLIEEGLVKDKDRDEVLVDETK